jgi:type IV pilus assembly protein PilQ
MRPTTDRFGGRHIVILLVMGLALWMTGCATPQESAAPPTAAPAPAQQSEGRVVSDILTTEDDSAITVMISGDDTLTYTSVKQPYPPGVVLYLPSTQLENLTDSIPVDNALISEIKMAEITGGETTTTRIEIALKADAEYTVNRQGNVLNVTFDKPVGDTAPAMEVPVEETAAMAEAADMQTPMLPSAAMFTGASAVTGDDGVTVKLDADGALNEYDAFTVNNPPRIVFDLYGVESPFKGEQIVPVNTEVVQKIRHFNHSGKVRVVIDTDAAYLTQFTAEPVVDGMSVTVGAPGEIVVPITQGTAPAPVLAAAKQAPRPAPPTPGGDKAWVNRIDFSSEANGLSTILVGTTLPVKYVMNTEGDQKLLLTLFDTNLPGYRKRPLITTRFESAVDRISPVQTAGMADKSIIVIELREAVSYTIEQLDDLIMINFDPSSVPPRPLQQAGLPDWQMVIDSAAEGAGAAAPIMAEPTMAAEAPPGRAPEAMETADMTMIADAGVYDDQRVYQRDVGKKFTGEKIALDFYETDIKNVFRILREVSGKNYAIDKDVAGKVTLSLDTPVPWDQVLDLVLRMNQLGMVYEGDIVRVATLATLKQEEQLRKEALEQAIAAKENEKKLAPLETGYFPINYADASRDILPHVQSLLSPDRGKVSVFEPTNQLIVVDTREKLTAITDMIKKLDRVTDQVLIEARVVEATANFKREFGATFSAGTGTGGGITVPGQMAGTYDLNFASATPPTASAGSFALDYVKVGGTPLTINAKLELLEQQGESKTISSPKVLTLDNKPAIIKQGVSYPINKLDADGNSTTEFKDIVLELQVTPHVTRDGRVSLKIFVTKNDLGALVGTNFSFTVNEANTELIVDDGDTIVIGGITKTVDRDGEEGVPGLKEIPLLGWLFKTASTENTKEELLIFITPRIVSMQGS